MVSGGMDMLFGGTGMTGEVRTDMPLEVRTWFRDADMISGGADMTPTPPRTGGGADMVSGCVWRYGRRRCGHGFWRYSHDPEGADGL
jgi:hypothetical protein